MATTTVVNESDFQQLREKLNVLSYVHPLGPKSAPLVSRLLADLLLAASSNKNHEVSARKLMRERDVLAAEVLPYKSENARLVHENNQLHLEIIKQAEDFERRERGWSVAMKRNESETKDAHFISLQNSNLIKKYETEVQGLRDRLAKSLERNLVAERPGIGLAGGIHGAPVMMGTGVEGTPAKQRRRYPQQQKGEETYPQALEWSGSRQNVEMSSRLVPSPKRRAPDPGGFEDEEEENDDNDEEENEEVGRRVVETLTASLKAAHGDLERVHSELENLQHTSRRSVQARDTEILRLSRLIETNGLSVVGGGINPPLMAGGNSDVSTHSQQTKLIEQLNDQIDYQNEIMSKNVRNEKKLKAELAALHNHVERTRQDEEEEERTKEQERQRRTRDTERELETTREALQESETRLRQTNAQVLQLRETCRQWKERTDVAERSTLQQSHNLKRATDELIEKRKVLQKYKTQEVDVMAQWEQGQTSNVHALRMVGTLQDETDRLRLECEALKREEQIFKKDVAVQNAEQERWMEERTSLENRKGEKKKTRWWGFRNNKKTKKKKKLIKKINR